MTKAVLTDKVFSRTWFIDLEGAPEVEFRQGGAKAPVMAVVSERIINDEQHLFIDIHPSKNTGARIHTYSSHPTAGGSSVDDLPAELLAALGKVVDW